MIKSPWDDPERNAAFFWALARTVLAVTFYLAGKTSASDSYVKADGFLDQFAKDALESQKREDPKP